MRSHVSLLLRIGFFSATKQNEAEKMEKKGKGEEPDIGVAFVPGAEGSQ